MEGKVMKRILNMFRKFKRRCPVKYLAITLLLTGGAIASASVAGYSSIYTTPSGPGNGQEEIVDQQDSSINADDNTSPDTVSGVSIRDILNQYSGDLSGITYIDAGERGITDLSGIEACANLDTLILWNNEISDISPLSKLPNLTCLFLGGNRISDVSPLSELPNLRELYIWRNEVSDLSPLSNATTLTRLDIQYNRVTDLSPLENLKNLTWICVVGNEVEDLSTIREPVEIYLEDR
jgi:Leucine-rich repeat (LRR) protein